MILRQPSASGVGLGSCLDNLVLGDPINRPLTRVVPEEPVVQVPASLVRSANGLQGSNPFCSVSAGLFANDDFARAFSCSLFFAMRLLSSTARSVFSSETRIELFEVRRTIGS